MVFLKMKLKCFKEVKDFIDEYDYYYYEEFNSLKDNDFIKVEDGYVPLEKIVFLKKEYGYEDCDDLEEFIDDIGYPIFEDFILEKE